MNTRILFSFVSHNSSSDLIRALSSLLYQIYPNTQVSFLIVENGLPWTSVQKKLLTDIFSPYDFDFSVAFIDNNGYSNALNYSLNHAKYHNY